MTDSPTSSQESVAPPAHHFTVDVEEYFHPTAVAEHFPITDWSDLPRRSPGVIESLLELLAEEGVLGTFFVLGWLADREPGMIRAIVAAGHEVASHGQEHALVGRLGPTGFKESVRRSKAVLEDISGAPVLGYRAPSFSIVPGLEWAIDTLLDEGYRYDASLFPIKQHPTYGYPTPSPDPYWIHRAAGALAEFPATTARVIGHTLPASGGAYFRLLPYGLVRTGLSQAQARRAPGMFYIHPWELDAWRPNVSASALQMLRTFARRGPPTLRRLGRLLREFRFQRIDQTLAQMRSALAK
jgi:polysaccharide deacetylase family protein (PEP-CTERM system associated)